MELAPVKTPDGYKVYRPAGTPAWPAMFVREDEQVVMVIAMHATLARLTWGKVIAGFVPPVAGFMLIGILAPILGNDIAGGLCCMISITVLVSLAMIDKLGRYVAWRFIGKRVVVAFARKQIAVDQKTWDRLPEVAVAFRQHAMPDLPERMLRKRADERALLNMTRNLDMIYGDQVQTIAVIPDPVRAEMFAAVLTRAAEFFDKPFDRPTATQSPTDQSSPKQIDPRDIPE